MIVAMTGHRPNKLPGEGKSCDGIEGLLVYSGATHLIQGMADGADLLSARVAFINMIPFTCARPWLTHKPGKGWEEDYENALKYGEVHVVTEVDHYTGPWLYHNRNKWMVDNADAVVAVWNGDHSGGTYATVKYAMQVGKRIFRWNPDTDKYCEITQKA